MTENGSWDRGLARLVVVALVASTVAVIATVGPAAPQTPPPAGGDGVVSFGQAPEVATGALSPNEADKLDGAVRSRFVDIPTGSVSPSLDAGRVDLELFPGVAVTLDGDGAPTTGASGSKTWSGLADNGDYATFTFIGGVMCGTAAVDGHVYDISPVSGKTHLIVEDGRVFPDEAEPVDAGGPAGDATAEQDPPTAESASTPRVDVLTWYDTDARTRFGGDTDAYIELTCTINETNAAYARSGANLTIASVGIEYVDYTGSGYTATELYRLASVADGKLDSVHARRDALNADLVSLITTLTDPCGRGYVGGPSRGTHGFSVVDASCARDGLSYAHELGHNLGAGHGMGRGTGLYTYSNGYRDDSNDFRTIMPVRYDDSSCPGGSCQRIGYFSSPTVLYHGHATGSATQDNARTLTRRAPIVAAYRGAPTGPGIPAANKIAAGGAHTCAVLDNGTVRCWGYGGDGRLGYGNTNWIGDNETPGSVGPVDLGAGRTAIQISAGAIHTCAVLDNGTVRCWGDNRDGELGYGNTNNIGDNESPGSVGPVDLGAGRTAVQISASGQHTCAVLDNGTVECWGYGFHGQLGYGNTTSIGDNETPGSVGPVDLGAGRTAVQISSGEFYTCAVLDNGMVKCWGDGALGELGYGNTASIGDNETPGSVGPVDLGAGRTAVQISSGSAYGHTCAVLDNGTVRCWGYGREGQLGYGNTTTVGDNETPGSVGTVDLGAGRTAVKIAAGDAHTCAVLDNGTVRCWGWGFVGQLGYGNTSNIGDNETPGSAGPVDLNAGRTAAQIVAGNSHTCVALDTGTVRCWGSNGSGQLGYGNTNNIGDNETPGSVADVGLLGVSGTVSESGTGAPIPGAFVAVLRATDFAIAGGGVTDTMGNFTVPVGEGDYYLYLVDPTGAHTTGFHGPPTTVNVADESLTDADPVMAPTRGSVTATVTETGTGTPIGGVWGLALSASVANTGATEAAVVANGSGQLTLPGLRPGNHFVGYIDPTGAHATRFFPNSPDVPDATPVAVTAGNAAAANVSLPAQTLVGTGSTITGTVTEAGTNAPLANARVLALRAADYQIVRAAATNASGQYSLNLAAGDYKLAFLDATGGHDMEWYDNLPSTGLGSAVSVTAPGVANAALNANTGSMAGTVTDDLTSAPIGGVWVLAIGPAGIAGGAVTGVDGTYTIAGLVPGTYRATFVDPHEGRVQEYWNNSPDYQGAATFNVTAANTTTAIDAALATPASE